MGERDPWVGGWHGMGYRPPLGGAGDKESGVWDLLGGGMGWSGVYDPLG